MVQPKPNPDKFVWQEGDIEIAKRGDEPKEPEKKGDERG